MAAVGVAPVRPRGEVLERVVRAAALPGVGNVRLRGAVAEQDVVGALERLAATRAQRLSEVERDRAEGWARRALETIRRDGVHVLLPGDARYPSPLLHLEHPPCPLFARGRLELLETPVVAVVGTRRASSYGLDTARRIAAGLAASGVTVISGLARGIDGAAHRAAGPGRTIGVLGCGIDVPYPRDHRRLQEAIGREGLLITEQLPGTPPARHNFPRRNRVIAGLAREVVVVEAPRRSGALSTAKKALDQGSWVFAVPGPIHDERSVGCNELIRDGARLITSAREVLATLGLSGPPPGFEADLPPAEIEGQGLALWKALRPEPLHVDELSATVGLDPPRTLASLLALEVQGHVRQLPGMRFVRA